MDSSRPQLLFYVSLSFLVFMEEMRDTENIQANFNNTKIPISSLSISLCITYMITHFFHLLEI